MPVPDYQSLMLPLLRIAAESDARVPQAAEKVADSMGLNESERDEMLPSGKQRLLHNRLHWAKFYLGKAGLLTSPSRGVFRASAAGNALLLEKPAAIDLKLLKTYPEFREFYNSTTPNSIVGGSEVDAPSSSATPEEQIDAAYGVLNAALKADLLQRVLSQSPSFFERVIVELLVAMGYGGSHQDAALRLGKSGDGGVDGVIDEDRLGLDRIYVQAKRYAPHVGVGRPEVQGFVGSLVGLGATKGVFVTTSSFSGHATDYVRHLPQRVVLIDGERLTELMAEHGVGVRVTRTIPIKRVDEDFFADE